MRVFAVMQIREIERELLANSGIEFEKQSYYCRGDCQPSFFLFLLTQSLLVFLGAVVAYRRPAIAETEQISHRMPFVYKRSQ